MRDVPQRRPFTEMAHLDPAVGKEGAVHQSGIAIAEAIGAREPATVERITQCERQDTGVLPGLDVVLENGDQFGGEAAIYRRSVGPRGVITHTGHAERSPCKPRYEPGSGSTTAPHRTPPVFLRPIA